jgi:predicted TIM-barrel fold metal-dependent hydrolase
MVLDTHVHIHAGPVEQARFISQLTAAGVDGCVLLSTPPKCCSAVGATRQPADRLAHLLEWTKGQASLYPFYWVDPTEADAQEQVAQAVQAGVSGFKIMCNHFYPGDKQAMPTYHAIAQAGKPILFHSGILWDGRASSKFNRPSEWEAMLDVPKLRFALAHISWPWVDECLAVYGKFLSALRSRSDLSCEMFIDVTPGTPQIYRHEALTKLFTIGYDVKKNVLFGTDGVTQEYHPEWAASWIKRDNEIYDQLGLAAEIRQNVFNKNLLRFMGK